MVKAKEPPVGFNFDLAKRNAYLEVRQVSTAQWATDGAGDEEHMSHRVLVLPQAKGVKSPGFTKTGTTIAGIIFKVSSLLPVKR